MASPKFLAAVKQEMASFKGKPNAHDLAVQAVIADRAKYGLPAEPFEGFCGLAGTPVDK
jgi:hypothetical protein